MILSVFEILSSAIHSKLGLEEKSPFEGGCEGVCDSRGMFYPKQFAL